MNKSRRPRAGTLPNPKDTRTVVQLTEQWEKHLVKQLQADIDNKRARHQRFQNSRLSVYRRDFLRFRREFLKVARGQIEASYRHGMAYADNRVLSRADRKALSKIQMKMEMDTFRMERATRQAAEALKYAASQKDKPNALEALREQGATIVRKGQLRLMPLRGRNYDLGTYSELITQVHMASARSLGIIRSAKAQGRLDGRVLPLGAACDSLCEPWVGVRCAIEDYPGRTIPLLEQVFPAHPRCPHHWVPDPIKR